MLRRLGLPAVLVAAAAALHALLAAAGLFEGAGGPLPGETLRRISLTLLVAAFFLLANEAVKGLVRSVVRGRTGRASVPGLLMRVVSLVLFVGAAVLVLGQIFGVAIGGLLAVSGVVGIVIGFALRGLLSDAFSGVALNLDAAFAIGDWIDIERPRGILGGQVREMDWRTTQMIDRDGNLIIVPNTLFANAILVNRSRPEVPTRYSARIQLDGALPVERAKAVLQLGLARAAAGGAVLEVPAPQVQVDAVEMNAVSYMLYFHIDAARTSPSAARNAVLESCLSLLALYRIPLARAAQLHVAAEAPSAPLDPVLAEDRAALLDAVGILAPLSPEERRHLASAGRLLRVPAGGAVIRQGEEGGSMFVCLEGGLSVTAEREGRSVPVGRLWPGDCLGEASLLTGTPRTATVTAATPSLLLEVGRAELEPLLRANPALVEALGAVMARRQSATETAVRGAGAEAAAAPHGLVSQIAGRIRSLFALHHPPGHH